MSDDADKIEKWLLIYPSQLIILCNKSMWAAILLEYWYIKIQCMKLIRIYYKNIIIELAVFNNVLSILVEGTSTASEHHQITTTST